MTHPFPKPLVDLLHKCDAGWSIFSFAWPMRTLRIVYNLALPAVRVEELIFHNKDRQLDPRGAWRSISSHPNVQDALQAMAKTQADIAAKRKREADRLTAKIKGDILSGRMPIGRPQ